MLKLSSAISEIGASRPFLIEEEEEHASSSSSCRAVSLAWAERPTAQLIDSSNPRLLRVTLASRGNSTSENFQQETSRPRSAVSTRQPTLQHPLEKQVMSLQELCPMHDFLQRHLQEPGFFGSQVT